METIEGHGGDVALAALRAAGVEEMFTLSGGHVFPLYDAAAQAGVRIVDVRHEQSAVFAAEAVAKLQRRPGLAVLTAGPGVTNGVSGDDQRLLQRRRRWSCSAGGRRSSAGVAAACRRSTTCRSSAPVTKHAATVVDRRRDRRRCCCDAARAALTPHRGPVFVDLPLDVDLLAGRRRDRGGPRRVPPVEPDPDEVGRGGARCSPRPQRPVDHRRVATSGPATPIAALRRGGRGAAGAGLRQRHGPRLPAADAPARVRPGPPGRAAAAPTSIAVIGTPLDFRLGFGDFGGAQVVHVVDAPTQRAGARHAGRLAGGRPARDPDGASPTTPATGPTTRSGSDRLRGGRGRRPGRARRRPLEADTDPIKPSRGLRRAAPGARPGRGDHRRRRRLRLVRRQVPRAVAARAPGSTRARTAASAPAWATRWAARVTYPDRQICVLHGRRRGRLLADGRRVAGPAASCRS